MDATLQRHCARYIYVIPDGLRELMTDISREVLRDQPEDMYTYIADYLDALLITRENARISAKFVQYLSEAAETIVELLTTTGMSRPEADRAATVVQEAFKAWGHGKGILKDDEETLVAKIIEEAGISEGQVQAAALVIQNAFRDFKKRQQREAQLLTGIIDWRVAARSAIRLYRKTGVSPEEAKRAASLIKAAYKGYYTRRTMKQLDEEISSLSEEGYEENEEMEDTYSTGSGTGDRKPKGVRIDYTSLVPHVDFGDEEVLSRDLTSIAEDVEPIEHKDPLMRIFGDLGKPEKSNEEFVKEILNEIIDRLLGADTTGDIPVLEDKDSDTDIFVPPALEEPKEPLYNRSLSLPVVSEAELETELQEARKEMVALREASTERHTVEQASKEEMELQPLEEAEVEKKETAEEPKLLSPIVEEKAEEPGETELASEAEEPPPPAEEAIEVPAEAPVESEIEVPAEAPVETEVEVTAEAPVETEVETPPEAPVEPEVAAPAEAPVEPEVAAPAEAPVEPEVAAPAEAPVETDVEVPVETEGDAPAQTEEAKEVVDSIVEEATDVPTEVPAEQPEVAEALVESEEGMQ